MNTYIFKVIPMPAFEVKEVYDEVNVKILNEELEHVRISVSTNDIQTAIKGAKHEASMLMLINYSDIPNIDKYQIRMILVSIEITIDQSDNAETQQVL